MSSDFRNTTVRNSVLFPQTAFWYISRNILPFHYVLNCYTSVTPTRQDDDDLSKGIIRLLYVRKKAK